MAESAYPFLTTPEEENFLVRVLRRGGQKLADTGRQIGADFVQNARDLRGAAERVVPPLAIVNAGIDQLFNPPRAQTELTQGPWYGTSSDPGTRVLAMAAGAAGPGGKPKPKMPSPRTMAPTDALQAALRGEHIAPSPKGSEGTFVGAPRNIETRRDLAENRRRMDRELTESARQIEASGQTVGDWYPSQRRGVEAMAEPWQQRRAAQETALMSAQTDPIGERGFQLQAVNRLARGEPPGIAHTGRQSREVAESAGQRDIKLGKKTGNYALLSDPTLPPTPYGTNDFRYAVYQGYTEPSGKPQHTGMNPREHDFMDAETLLQTERANRKALGGRVDWTGQMIQETPWIWQKAQALMKRSPAQFPPTPEGRNAAIRAAMTTGEQANLQYAAGANYERLPGASTGHDPSILSAPWEERVAYSRDAPWYTPEGRDVLYRAQGLYQLPTTEGVGIWQGKTNPNFTAKPLADVVKGGEGREIAPGMLQQLKLAEHLRGLVDVQEASVAHLPMTQKTMKARSKGHALLEHEGSLSEPEMRSLADLAPGFTPTPTPRGTLLMQFDRPAAKVRREITALQDPIAQGQLTLTPAAMEGTGLIPVYSRSTGQPIAPGKGIATARFLRQAARSPEESVLRMGEDPSVRGAIRGVIGRDLDRAAAGKEIRSDVQNTRRFFAEADWPKVVAMLRENPRLKVGAAMAALGYSLEGMAGTEERPR